MRPLIVLVVFVLCFSVVNCRKAQDLKIVRAEGMGMSPAITDGDRLVIDQRFYEKDAGVERFDIVAFEVSPDLFHYKRAIGMPGEKIEIRNGETFINDKLLGGPFEMQRWSESNLRALVIPEGEYFVMGDNRPNSADSRIWEPPTIKKGQILGKVIEVVRKTK